MEGLIRPGTLAHRDESIPVQIQQESEAPVDLTRAKKAGLKATQQQRQKKRSAHARRLTDAAERNQGPSHDVRRMGGDTQDDLRLRP